MVVRVAAIPLATRSADRHDALRVAMVIASALSLIGYGAMGFAEGAVAITIAFALASVFYAPLMPLSDAYALRGLAALGRAYGPVRLWGSAAFIAGSLGAGLLLAPSGGCRCRFTDDLLENPRRQSGRSG